MASDGALLDHDGVVVMTLDTPLFVGDRESDVVAAKRVGVLE